MRSEGAGGAWKNLTEECAGAAPSPRSGHRAAVLGGRMVIFGGFFDNGKEEKEYPPAGYSMGFRRGKGKGGGRTAAAGPSLPPPPAPAAPATPARAAAA